MHAARPQEGAGSELTITLLRITRLELLHISRLANISFAEL